MFNVVTGGNCSGQNVLLFLVVRAVKLIEAAPVSGLYIKALRGTHLELSVAIFVWVLTLCANTLVIMGDNVLA